MSTRPQIRVPSFFWPIVFLLVLACVCAGVFWAVIHSREVSLLNGPPGYVNMHGMQAPRAPVTTISGRRFIIGATTRPMLLELFATWCPECQKEVPALNKIAAARNATVLAVTGDSRGRNYGPETLADLRTFVRLYHVHYDVAFDRTLSVARLYHTVAFPNIVIIRPDGLIEYNMSGAMPYADLKIALDRAIANSGKPPAALHLSVSQP